MKFNLDSALRTAVTAQGYHGYGYIVKAYEVSQLARGRAGTGWA